MNRARLEKWQPLPEEYMHRGEQIAIGVVSSAPGVVGLVACDDAGMTCGLSLAPADAERSPPCSTGLRMMQGRTIKRPSSGPNQDRHKPCSPTAC